MVEQDQLEALDTLQWFRSSTVAAMATFSCQSTIIRRSSHSLRTFGVALQRSRGKWRISGDTLLLNLERHVHQEARFIGRSRLRLHWPWWTSRLLSADLRNHLAKRWVFHPDVVRDRADDPVSLLQDRVIDACLVTPTQMLAVPPDFCTIDIYQSEIQLMALAGDRTPFVSEYHEARNCRLPLLDFLPDSCRCASRIWFDRHFGMVDFDAGELEAARTFEEYAYLTPAMVQASGIAGRPQCSSPRPYTERLVVRQEHRDHPDVQELLTELSDWFGRSDHRVAA